MRADYRAVGTCAASQALPAGGPFLTGVCVGVTVKMFDKDVQASCIDGCVVFEKSSFVRAVGEKRAKHIFDGIMDVFDFMGQEGVVSMLQDGKEYLLCSVIIMDPDASLEAKEYANAWVHAYELLQGGK